MPFEKSTGAVAQKRQCAGSGALDTGKGGSDFGIAGAAPVFSGASSADAAAARQNSHALDRKSVV